MLWRWLRTFLVTRVLIPADAPSPTVALFTVLVHGILMFVTIDAWRVGTGAGSCKEATAAWLAVGTVTCAVHVMISIGYVWSLRRWCSSVNALLAAAPSRTASRQMLLDRAAAYRVGAGGGGATAVGLAPRRGGAAALDEDDLALTKVLITRNRWFAASAVLFLWCVVWITVTYAHFPLAQCTSGDRCCTLSTVLSSVTIFYYVGVAFLSGLTLWSDAGRTPPRWWETILIRDLRQRELAALHDEMHPEESRQRPNSNQDTDREMLRATTAFGATATGSDDEEMASLVVSTTSASFRDGDPMRGSTSTFSDIRAHPSPPPQPQPLHRHESPQPQPAHAASAGGAGAAGGGGAVGMSTDAFQSTMNTMSKRQAERLRHHERRKQVRFKDEDEAVQGGMHEIPGGGAIGGGGRAPSVFGHAAVAAGMLWNQKNPPSATTSQGAVVPARRTLANRQAAPSYFAPGGIVDRTVSRRAVSTASHAQLVGGAYVEPPRPEAALAPTSTGPAGGHDSVGAGAAPAVVEPAASPSRSVVTMKRPMSAGPPAAEAAAPQRQRAVNAAAVDAEMDDDPELQFSSVSASEDERELLIVTPTPTTATTRPLVVLGSHAPPTAVSKQRFQDTSPQWPLPPPPLIDQPTMVRHRDPHVSDVPGGPSGALDTATHAPLHRRAAGGGASLVASITTATIRPTTTTAVVVPRLPGSQRSKAHLQ